MRTGYNESQTHSAGAYNNGSNIYPGLAKASGGEDARSPRLATIDVVFTIPAVVGTRPVQLRLATAGHSIVLSADALATDPIATRVWVLANVSRMDAHFGYRTGFGRTRPRVDL